MWKSLNFVYFLYFLITLSNAKNLIISPPKCPQSSTTNNTTTTTNNINYIPAVFIFAGGASCSPDAYLHLLSQVQSHGCALGMKIWVGLPRFFLDNWGPQSQFDAAIRSVLSDIKSDMRTFGIVDFAKIAVFYGGHSRGGVAMQDMIRNVFTPIDSSDSTITTTKTALVLQDDHVNRNDNVDILKEFANGGLVLFSSAIQRKYRKDQNGIYLPFEYPTLTIGGELDGLFRVFRLAEAFYHHGLYGNDPEILDRAIFYNPVVVIRGANHWSFGSGEVPFFVRINDIPSEISQHAAQSEISSLTFQFIYIHGKRIYHRHLHPSAVLEQTKEEDGNMGVAGALLSQAYKESLKYFTPILSALEYEGSYHLKPPCNEIPKDDTRDCWKGSSWAERSQISLSNLPQTEISVSDAFWKVWLINPVHLPEIKNNCTIPSDCKLEISTVSQCTYPLLDGIDFGFFPISCDEIRSKFKSRQSSHIAAGLKKASFKDLDDNDYICKSINDEALSWALKNAGVDSIGRYLSKGVRIQNGLDVGPYNAGPEWIWRGLQYNKMKKEDGTVYFEVRSPNMRTPNDYLIKAAAGFHYCKLLSPARALEWIYIDSLKNAK